MKSKKVQITYSLELIIINRYIRHLQIEWGASVHTVLMPDRSGRVDSVTLCNDSLNNNSSVCTLKMINFLFLKAPKFNSKSQSLQIFSGAVIGRVAGCISSSHFQLGILQMFILSI